MLTVPTAVLASCVWAGVAQAMPGDMPWDHAGGPGKPDCTACHFEAEAAPQSPALRLSGLPERADAGASYEMMLRFEAEGLVTAGFLIRAEARLSPGEAVPAGKFTPANERTEAGEGAVRSTAAGAQQQEPGVAEWRFSWRAPEDFSGMVTMFIAGTAGNDDQSPLGDRVHLRQIDIRVNAAE